MTFALILEKKEGALESSSVLIACDKATGAIIGSARAGDAQDLLRLARTLADRENPGGIAPSVQGFDHSFEAAMRKNGVREAAFVAFDLKGNGRFTLHIGGAGHARSILEEAIRPVIARMEALDKARSDQQSGDAATGGSNG